MTALVVVAVALVALVALACARVRASVSLQASAGEDGWAIAGGASVGPIAVSGARAHGVSGAWVVHLFGRKLIGSGARAKKSPPKRGRAVARRAWRVGKEIDPVVALELAADALGRVRVESFELYLRGGDPDPLLMGRVAAVVAVASGVLAPVATIDAALDWAAESTSLDARVACEATFVPAALAYDAARFVFRSIALRARTALARPSVPALERA